MSIRIAVDELRLVGNTVAADLLESTTRDIDEKDHMRTCTNCDELYDDRDGAFGLCDPCWSSARSAECGDDCECGGTDDQ